jgi:Fic family protein
VQFETIYPFLGGNGRLGRLLITLLLCVAGAIREPILYLSLYFKTNRLKYYELLDRVRTHRDWETWPEFFPMGVKETAQQTADTSREILTLIKKVRSTSCIGPSDSCVPMFDGREGFEPVIPACKIDGAKS